RSAWRHLRGADARWIVVHDGAGRRIDVHPGRGQHRQPAADLRDLAGIVVGVGFRRWARTMNLARRAAALLSLLLLSATMGAAQSLLDELQPLLEEQPDNALPQMPEFEFLGDGSRPRSSVADPGSGAILRVLDTITGRVENVEATVGETIAWERLEIEVMACRY